MRVFSIFLFRCLRLTEFTFLNHGTNGKAGCIYVSAKRLALCLQVLPLVFAKAGSESVIDTLVVGVDPRFLVLGEKGHIQQPRVVEAKSERLKLVVLLAGGAVGKRGIDRRRQVLRTGFDGQNEVFGADTVFARAVDTGFVGEDIALLNGIGVVVGADIGRSFVAAHKVSDSVSRAVSVSDAFLPHILMGEDVKLVAARTFGETDTGKGDMSFHDERIVAAQPIGYLCFIANPNGAGDVGGAVEVLTAGVKEQHTVAFYAGALVRLGVVVDDGTVGVPTGDGAETLVRKVLTLCAIVVQAGGKGKFGLIAIPFVLPLVKPAEEAGQSHAVFNHCCAFALYLRLVLDAHHLLHGAWGDQFYFIIAFG